jgi:D-alanyl-D-alanine carboxypeptidase
MAIDTGGGARMTLLRRFVGVLALLLALAGCSGSADDDRPPADRSVQVNRTSASSLPTAAETFPAPSRSRLGGDLVRELQRILDDAVAGGDSPDLAAAAVISTKGRWVGIAGRDLEGGALTAQTTFAIASITKTFTAAEVLLLAERGQVDLDAPLSRYVDMPVTDLGATVRDALGMRSGIPDYLRTQVIDELALRRDRRVTVDDMLSRVRGAPSRPNVIFTYSNTNYLLLGQLIEEVTGMTYAAAIRRDLTSPLGLGGRIVAQDEQRPVPPLAPAAVRGRTRYLPNRALASGTWAAVRDGLRRGKCRRLGLSAVRRASAEPGLPTSHAADVHRRLRTRDIVNEVDRARSDGGRASGRPSGREQRPRRPA